MPGLMMPSSLLKIFPFLFEHINSTFSFSLLYFQTFCNYAECLRDFSGWNCHQNLLMKEWISFFFGSKTYNFKFLSSVTFQVLIKITETRKKPSNLNWQSFEEIILIKNWDWSVTRNFYEIFQKITPKLQVLAMGEAYLSDQNLPEIDIVLHILTWCTIFLHLIADLSR